jgi:hypothetical protein
VRIFLVVELGFFWFGGEIGKACSCKRRHKNDKLGFLTTALKCETIQHSKRTEVQSCKATRKSEQQTEK